MVGLCVYGSANVMITGNSVIASNSNAGGTDNSTHGGGVWAADDSTVTITGTTRIANNTSLLEAGGGLGAEDNSVVHITGHSRVELNRAVNASGAGLSARGNATIRVSGNATVSHNACERKNGGGIYVTGDATVTLRDSAILHGSAVVNASGGAIAADGKSTVDIGPRVLFLNNSVGKFGSFDGGADIGVRGMVSSCCWTRKVHSPCAAAACGCSGCRVMWDSFSGRARVSAAPMRRAPSAATAPHTCVTFAQLKVSVLVRQS